MKRRRQRRRPALTKPRPDSLIARMLEEDAAKRPDSPVARMLKELETKPASLFAEVFSTPRPNLVELMLRSGSDADGGSKHQPGAVDAWIDEVCPNDEWRLVSAKAVEKAIVAEIDKRNKNKTGPRIQTAPSYSAIQKNIKERKTQRAKTQKT